MKIREKMRTYLPEPLLATVTIAILKDFFSFHDLANFVHTEARDILSLLLVILASSLALWVGLFWVSNTSFGAWLIEKGELDGIQATFKFTIVGAFLACMACIVAAYLDSIHVVVQIGSLWMMVFSLFTVPFLLNNTSLLLKLHVLFSIKSQKVTSMDRQSER